MTDPLDFRGLRHDVESATMLPEFAGVARRARRLRLRSRLATLAALLAAVAILVPGMALATRTQHTEIGPATQLDDQAATDGPGGATPAPSGPARFSVAAVAGVDLAHLYALVDICHGDACDLQLCAVRPRGVANSGPIRTGLLRTSPSSWLAAPTLQALTRDLLLVGGNTRTGHESVQVDTAGDGVASSTGPMASGSNPVQLAVGGELSAFDLVTGRMVALGAQPALDTPAVAPGVAASKGIWAYGVIPNGTELGVSVSVNGGTRWTTTALGVPVGAATPVLATYDGRTGYLLTRLDTGGYALFATRDAGLSWTHLPAWLPWPTAVPGGGGYGLVVRPDGTLLAWLDTGLTVAYLNSSDGGATFTATATGPGGPVYAISDGYVSVGTAPKLSHDAATWSPATIPGFSG